MELYEVDFDCKKNNGAITLTGDNDEYHVFYFEFTTYQDYTSEECCHSCTQLSPDEDVYTCDVIDEILDFDKLIHKIETVFEVENIKNEVFNFINEEFDKKSEKTYSHTNWGVEEWKH